MCIRDSNSLDRPDPLAVRIGASNLEHMIGIVKSFGLPVVVAINKFPTDTPEEIVIMQDVAIDAGASAAVICNGFQHVGEGAIDLAEAVVRASEVQIDEISYLYPVNSTITGKVRTLAEKIYGAADVKWEARAIKQADYLNALIFAHANDEFEDPETLSFFKEISKNSSLENSLFDEIFIKKRVRYKVIPIGIRTTIPAIKLFRIVENSDLFAFFLDIFTNVWFICTPFMYLLQTTCNQWSICNSLHMNLEGIMHKIWLKRWIVQIQIGS